MKKLKWWFNRLFFNTTYKLIGLDVGPIMYQIRGNYYFIDAYGSLWQLKPTMDPSMPIVITLLIHR